MELINFIFGFFSIYANLEALQREYFGLCLALFGLTIGVFGPCLANLKAVPERIKKPLGYAIAILYMYFLYESFKAEPLLSAIFTMAIAVRWMESRDEKPRSFLIYSGLYLFMAVTFTFFFILKTENLQKIQKSNEIHKVYSESQSDGSIKNNNVLSALGMVCLQLQAEDRYLVSKPAFSCTESTTKALLAKVTNSEVNSKIVKSLFDGRDLAYATKMAIDQLTFEVAFSVKDVKKETDYINRVAPHLKESYVISLNEAIHARLDKSSVIDSADKAYALEKLIKVAKSGVFADNKEFEKGISKKVAKLIEISNPNLLADSLSRLKKETANSI